jgi:hypothetical protein
MIIALKCFGIQAPDLTCKYDTILKKLVTNKQSSLLTELDSIAEIARGRFLSQMTLCLQLVSSLSPLVTKLFREIVSWA